MNLTTYEVVRILCRTTRVKAKRHVALPDVFLLHIAGKVICVWLCSIASFTPHPLDNFVGISFQAPSTATRVYALMLQPQEEKFSDLG